MFEMTSTPLVNSVMMVGFLKLLMLLYRLLNSIVRTIRGPHHLEERYGKGSYALVTGASDGIGLGYCKELAKNGFNIVMISRSQSRLEAAAEEVRKVAPSVKIEIVPFDFEQSQHENEYISQIIEKVKHLDISIAIHNAGYSQCGAYKDVPLYLHKRMIDVNVVPCVLLPKLLLPTMKKRTLRSANIWVSSVNAVHPTAGHATYCGTKVFEDFMARSLSHELRDKIDCMCHRPGVTSTKMVGHYKENFMCINADKCAGGSIKNLGFENFTSGSLQHELSLFALKQMSRFTPEKFCFTWFSKADRVWKKIS